MSNEACPALIGLVVGVAASISSAREGLTNDQTTQPQQQAIPGIREFSGQLIVRPARASKPAGRPDTPRASSKAVDRLSPLVVKHYAEVDEYVVRVAAGMSDAAFAAQLMATGDYEYAHPNWIVYPTEIPDDPWFWNQWHHHQIGSLSAWDSTTGDPGLIMAFTDTGIDRTHPDLAAHRVPGFNAVSDKAEAQGGKVDDVHGHGTLVAGAAGAIGDNGLGVAGVTWNCRLMMCRVTDNPNGQAHLDDILQAARWAVDHGARTISTSYSGVESDTVQTTGSYIRSKGGLYFYAAGNDGTNLSWFDWGSVIIVGASNKTDTKSPYSNYGPAIDLFAPGDAILTTAKGGGYKEATGTSLATPLVNGAAALLWSISPNLSASELQATLQLACKDLGSPGNDNVYGYGRIDVGTAVQLAVPQAPIAQDDYQVSVGGDEIQFQAIDNDEDPNPFDDPKVSSYDKVSALGGAISVKGNDKFEYEPPEGVENAVDSFSYEVIDRDGLKDTATVYVTLLPSLRQPDAHGTLKAGAWAEYYIAEGYEFLPDFGALTPYAAGPVSAVNFPSDPGEFADSGRDDGVGAVISGYIDVPQSGTYRLYLNSDDGSMLYLGGLPIIGNDGLHPMTERSVEVSLAKGTHSVRINYWENTGDSGLVLSIYGGGLSKQSVPIEMWAHEQACPADLNLDGLLDLFDFLAFASAFGLGDPVADFDANGVLDMFDFLEFSNQFGKGCP
jgi:subtilisin family serine protease